MRFQLIISFLAIATALQATTALVTGGAGFLGSHMCDRLLSEGYQVIAIDNLQTGNQNNIAHLFDNPNFSFIEWDVVEPFRSNMPLDVIYNFACPASPIHYQADPLKTLRTNFSGIYHLLELAREHGATFFQASTSEVYGDPDLHPQPESYWGSVNCFGVRSCYDEGKRVGEALCFAHHAMYQTKIKIARIFNTYGPRMAENDGRVVSNRHSSAEKIISLKIYVEATIYPPWTLQPSFLS